MENIYVRVQHNYVWAVDTIFHGRTCGKQSGSIQNTRLKLHSFISETRVLQTTEGNQEKYK